MSPNSQQRQALKLIDEFVSDENLSVFILKGYAGTGKTTLVKDVIPLVEKKGRKVFLMAPTGRAAKVLGEKTGATASTIHHGIYELDRILADGNEGNGGQVSAGAGAEFSDGLQMVYGIRKRGPDENPAECVYIVDEASMVASGMSRGETFRFGSGVLMDDLLSYVSPRNGGKIIFVGDPAQLPPVGETFSAALDEKFFAEKGLSAISYELTEVVRQDKESAVLENAMAIRSLLFSGAPGKMRFRRRKGEVEDIEAWRVAESFCGVCPRPDIGAAVVICYSNSLAKKYNDAIRRRYFPGSGHVEEGDVLQVVRNNVNRQLDTELYNGDFVRIVWAGKDPEVRSAPVWTGYGENRRQVTVSLGFRDAVLEDASGLLTRCKIVDSLLDSPAPGLTPLEQAALWVGFKMRYRGGKKDREAFWEALARDPYFNAVHVKYGYAVTGHKSQGGEWKTVYADYNLRTGTDADSLRWAYTVTTRTRGVLYGVNMPSRPILSDVTVCPVIKYGKVAKEAFSWAEAEAGDFLPASAEAFQKQKCACVEKGLSAAGFSLVSVERLQFMDRYTMEVPSGRAVAECWYNGAGLYTRCDLKNSPPESGKLEAIFADESGMKYDVAYEPSRAVFSELYAVMKSACGASGVTITNVAEHPEGYYVAYYLKTSGKFSRIQFFFNKNLVLTRMLPFSDEGAADEKLRRLVETIRNA